LLNIKINIKAERIALKGGIQMRNEKGVTLMILVTTIVIISLIVGSISYSSVSTYKMNAYYNMRSDIELLDEKIALYYIQNEKQLPIIESDSKNINDLITNYYANNVNYNPNNSGNLYKIDLEKLDNLSLNYTNYYIDEQSHTIYKSKGVKVGNDVYYTTPVNYKEVNLSLYK
jgi:hypothetical protein